ncbi:hypothetical protein Pmani_025501 [Petrolisthes manimaculis]|uniref:Uncharacterized protein n=1 Tax=Petrolisthes manimaculis TaxID=1843537 RepID=A0AAE1U134_9EUCA|nr:hypothetical protein Pmani_025501 [Petrolisthes manimaculis]
MSEGARSQVIEEAKGQVSEGGRNSQVSEGIARSGRELEARSGREPEARSTIRLHHQNNTMTSHHTRATPYPITTTISHHNLSWKHCLFTSLTTATPSLSHHLTH